MTPLKKTDTHDKIHTELHPVNSKVKPRENDTKCTQPCSNENDSCMILCNKCRKWTHYSCSQLPLYQLYFLISSSRRYKCELCTIISPDFTSKWQNKLVTKNITNHENSCKIDKTTLDVVARFEKSMVDALKSIHNSNKDQKISK